MQKLRNYINNILGDVNRCILPSSWWKKMFSAIIDKIENLEITITKNLENLLKDTGIVELNIRDDDFNTLLNKCAPLYVKFMRGTLNPMNVKITPYTIKYACRFIALVCSEDHIQLVCEQCDLSSFIGRIVILHFYKDKEGFEVQPLERGLIHDFSGVSSSSEASYKKDNSLMNTSSPFYINVASDIDEAISRPLCIRQSSFINPDYYIVDYFYDNKLIKLKIYKEDGSVEKLETIHLRDMYYSISNLENRIKKLEGN